MNREDIIRMAREAGAEFAELPMMDAWLFTDDECLERFATIVASAERERIKQANAPEIERVNAHIKELEDACKKPEQEPVTWIDKMVIDVPNQILYTAPQRTWVGLRDDEIKNACDKHTNWFAIAFDLEAKLKEKNT